MRGIDLEMAFSLNKQSAIGTAIAVGNIDRLLPYTTFAPSVQEFPNLISDKDWYGKGHSFATFQDPVTKRIMIPNREFSLSNLSALFAPAMVLGDLTTTQPSTAQPTVYDHKFVFQDPATNPQALYTSFIEKFGSIEQNLISGAVIEQFTLTGNLTEHVNIGWQGVARRMVANADSMPNLSSQDTFFETLNGTFKFNQSGGSEVDISTKLVSWNLTATQGASHWWLPGNPTGQKDLLTKSLIGKQGISGQLVTLFEDTDQRDLFKANTECEASIVLLGDQIGSTGLYYTVTITIPHLKIPSEAFGEEQDQVTLTLPFTEESVLKATGEDYFSITVRTDEDDTYLLVAA